MTTNQADTRILTRVGLATLLLGAVLGFVGASSTAQAAGNDHQITICHATGSQTNPYSTPNPAKWEITVPGGHGSHLDDIIPPFPAGSKGSHSWDAYPGLNWDAAGQQIYNAGCNIVAPSAGGVTLDKVTSGDGQPAGTTAFTFSVVCGSGSVPDTAPVITPDMAASTVATGVAVGDSCTVGETDAAGAESTSFSVDGGAAQAGPVVVTIANAEQSIAIVATNNYACPEGQTADGSGGCSVPDACPNTPAIDAPGTECNPVVDACPNTVAIDAPGTDCNPVTDACPDLAGLQEPGADCTPTSVEGETLTASPPAQTVAVAAPAPAAAPQTEVLGATLPRTGTDTTPLAEVGLALVLLGAGIILLSRRMALA